VEDAEHLAQGGELLLPLLDHEGLPRPHADGGNPLVRAGNRLEDEVTECGVAAEGGGSRSHRPLRMCASGEDSGHQRAGRQRTHPEAEHVAPGQGSIERG
jgi:hypothetical protein